MLKNIFERSTPGHGTQYLPPTPWPEELSSLPEHLARQRPLRLPELSEGEVARHFAALASQNYGIDTGSYPLGSCTMKYNPKINELLARLPGFADVHPWQPAETTQGALRLMAQLAEDLAEISGMHTFSLAPAAGAHGELCGMLIIQQALAARGQSQRRVVLVPDTAHGTNPASAAMAGYQVVTVPSGADGRIHLAALRPHLNEQLAALMLTNPNTLGIFESEITDIARNVHQAGGLLYYDGANLNAIMGRTRPGDMGFDVLHLNLHKTFATPHGGGGPGAGPVGVTLELEPYLPLPRLERADDGSLFLSYAHPQTIGMLRAFAGNFLVLVRAYAYIHALGGEGLADASTDAVLNATYLREALADTLPTAYDTPSLHEFVLSLRELRAQTGVRAMDVAKALLDLPLYPPTVYFPLVVEEAMMVEPTETESRADLDFYAQALRTIVAEAHTDPAQLAARPVKTPISRPDEARAVRQPRLVSQR